MNPERIPLFPLELVLFPGMPLPLHIFEPRYKLLIQNCLRDQSEFGVVLARAQGIAAVGCTAEILRVVRKYSDGRMDILTAGQTLYRVLEVFEEQPYFEASVEFLEDEHEAPSTEALEKVLKLYEQCHTLIFGRAPRLPDTASGFPLTFQIAGELPLDLDYKQELLEMRTEHQRQESMLARMHNWLPQLTQLHRVRRRAGGNGHGLG
jgi:ATP-dependent Lon protease